MTRNVKWLCELLSFFLTTRQVLVGKEFTQEYKFDVMDSTHPILAFDYSCGEQILYLGKSIACQEYLKNGLSNMYMHSSVYSIQFCSIIHFMFMYILCEVPMYIWVTFFLQYHLFESVNKSTKQYIYIATNNTQQCSHSFQVFVSYIHQSSIATRVGRFTRLHSGPITYDTHMYFIVPILFYFILQVMC